MSDNNATPKTVADAPKPLWAGRFSAAPTGELERFGASLPFDKRMWRQDIRGSKAHAAMLAHQGVISQQDADAIRAGLDDIAGQIERGEFTFDVDRDEDIHMAIERVLTENIGPAGGRLHTAAPAMTRRPWTRTSSHATSPTRSSPRLAKLEAVLLDRAQGEFRRRHAGLHAHGSPCPAGAAEPPPARLLLDVQQDFRRVSAAREAANVCPLAPRRSPAPPTRSTAT